MKDKRQNFLLAFGEKLTKPVVPPGKKSDKNHPYSIDTALSRLRGKIANIEIAIQSLPKEVCPNNEVVVSLTLHPAYLAKSYFPENLLASLGLRAVGSKPKIIRPEISTRKKNKVNNENQITSEIFIAGNRKSFLNLNKTINEIKDKSILEDIVKIEDLDMFSEVKKIKEVPKNDLSSNLEVVLHASAMPEDDFILDSFFKYSKSLKAIPAIKRRRHVGGLCFIPVTAPSSAIKELAKFSFLRAIRSMPNLRPLKPGILRSGSIEPSFELTMDAAMDSSIQVAIFDGGIKPESNLSRWVKAYKTKDLGAPVSNNLTHGHAVTSAFLFGSIKPNSKVNKPYSNVDHYRVLDVDTANPSDLFDVLDRIMNILEQKPYQFVNISLGPNIPVEDDDVHVWTATFDEYLSSGKTLATFAAGNTGDLDSSLKLNRIQPPADCVNALSVGASDTQTNNWIKAVYSSVGPGRSPGIIKPDGIAFGGSKNEPFYVVNQSIDNKLFGLEGTSFASPFVLRAAVGVRALLGEKLNPLALKALLIHHTKIAKHSKNEVGWGHFNINPEYLISCEDCEATVVYQGELIQGKYLRAPIPFPKETLTGQVSIKATFCFAAYIDPENPNNYTRSGLEIIFRPNIAKDSGKKNAKSGSFFSQKKLFSTEQELRNDAHKWETCLHQEKKFKANTLKDPTFDIHYQARENGKIPQGKTNLAYSLIVTIRAPKVPDLYTRIVNRYEILQPLRPINKIIINS